MGTEMQIKYTGALRDYSGYGEAARHDVASLLSAGVELSTEIPSYTLEISDFGKIGQLALDCENKKLDYKIKILHITPNVYNFYVEEGKYHIGRVFWETDKLPSDFSRNLHLLDEIWTGSEYNAQAIRNSGVTDVPIHIITEAIDANVDVPEPYLLSGGKELDEKTYKFYSVFEWTERKNPFALLTAYWQEFDHNENVAMILKTYIDNFTPKKRTEIEEYIKRIKRNAGVDQFAPVYVVNRLMNRNQIYRFHRSMDCFVSAHRGEGWGIPQMEAMLMSKPVISTNLGGIHEYLTNKKDSYLPSYKLVPLRGNNRNQQWYTTDQNWGEVNIEELRKYMRACYKNRNKARAMGMAGKRTVEKLFALEVVGKKMRDRLEEIEKGLK